MNWIIRNIFIIKIDNTHTIWRKHLNFLHLLMNNIANIAKRIQMLGTNTWDNSILRPYHLHQILNITNMVSTHFTDKNLMNILEFRTNSSCNAHWRIVGCRSHQSIEMITQNISHNILGSSLAIRTSDAYLNQICIRIKNLDGIIFIILLNQFLNRQDNQSRNINNQIRTKNT